MGISHLNGDRAYRTVSNSTRSGNTRNLINAELVVSVSWLIKLRWIAGAGVLIVTIVIENIFHLGAPYTMLYGIGVSILLYNLYFYVSEQKASKSNRSEIYYQRLTIWQTVLDWIAMTLLFHYSGGIESPAIWYFIFHIIISAIFFPLNIAFTISILAILLVSGTTFLEYVGILTHQPLSGFLPQPLYQQPLYILGVLGFYSSTAVIVTFLVGSIQNHLRQRESEIIELTENLQRTTKRLQALNECAKIVGSTLELKQVLERMVETTAKAMEARACSIRMLDKSGRYLEPVAVYGLSQTYINKGPVDGLTNLLARETLSGKVVNIPNAPESPLLQYPEEARAEGIKSMLSAPLLGKNGPMGILRVYAVEPNRFNQEDEEFISAIAAQGSIAIENALAYQGIQELDKMKSQFIQMVTHELRSPVSVTRSLLRTITAGYAGDLNEQQRDILDRAVRRIEFLQKLVDDLLDLATGKAQPKLDERPVPTELIAVIRRVIARYQIPVKEKGITLEFLNKCQCEEIRVYATIEGLDRILNNLLSNAVKYTLKDGKVTISLERMDGEVHLAVQDTGIGIPEESLPKLFQEFYRAPNAKEIENEGTGLGLSIIKDIINRFGGRITVESKLGKGSTFNVFLPLEGVEKP